MHALPSGLPDLCLKCIGMEKNVNISYKPLGINWQFLTKAFAYKVSSCIFLKSLERQPGSPAWFCSSSWGCRKTSHQQHCYSKHCASAKLHIGSVWSAALISAQYQTNPRRAQSWVNIIRYIAMAQNKHRTNLWIELEQLPESRAPDWSCALLLALTQVYNVLLQTRITALHAPQETSPPLLPSHPTFASPLWALWNQQSCWSIPAQSPDLKGEVPTSLRAPSAQTLTAFGLIPKNFSPNYIGSTFPHTLWLASC